MYHPTQQTPPTAYGSGACVLGANRNLAKIMGSNCGRSTAASSVVHTMSVTYRRPSRPASYTSSPSSRHGGCRCPPPLNGAHDGCLDRAGGHVPVLSSQLVDDEVAVRFEEGIVVVRFLFLLVASLVVVAVILSSFVLSSSCYRTPCPSSSGRGGGGTSLGAGELTGGVSE